MDDPGDDARYPPIPYGLNQQQGYGSLNRQKIPFRGGSYPRPVGSHYGDEDEEDDEEDEELGEEEDVDDNNNNGVSNGYPVVRKDDADEDDDDDDGDDDDDDDDDDEDDDEDGDHAKRKDYGGRSEVVDLEIHRKKRKMKSLVSSYEFAPRVLPPSGAKPSSSTARQSFPGNRNSLTDWTERETFVLLDAWGDRFLLRGKKSLRSEEWQEVAEKVSEVSKVDRTDTQCRNRLDTLKKKYKKEKLSPSSKWVYFKKMDLLMSTSTPQQQTGLSCGVDSGEYVFMNPRVYLNRANGLDEMRDSPGNSESADDDEGSDGLPPKKRKYERDIEEDDNNEGSSFRLIANSIHKFSEIYEKIEASKRQQMMEIEKMRMDFQRELEMQKRQIMERAHAEIAKIRRGDDDDVDVSAENGSG